MSIAATSSEEEQATCTNGLADAFRVGPNLVDGLLGILKSQTQREEGATVTKVDDVGDGFHAMLVNRGSSKPLGMGRSILTLPTNGFGLCPLASQISTPDPRVAARYKVSVADCFGSNASEDIEFVEEVFVA